MNWKELKSQAIKVEDYNSCNAWGFGGAVGKKYHFYNEVSMLVATAYYRHARPHKFIRVDTVDEWGYLDVNGSKLTQYNIDRVYDLINK